MKEINKIPLIFLFFLIVACNDRKNYVPKPPTYLKIDFPERTYDVHVDNCKFKFEKPNYFTVKEVERSTCHRDISFGEYNGTLHLSYIPMDTSLAAYINHAIDKVDEHKVKATAIKDTNFIISGNKVFGTFFELQGNVASPFQFYLTDSTTVFLSGVVYFNARPNYDSIRPVLKYVKTDIYRMIETMEWK